MAKPTVVFQTDFGPGGGGVLAGVVKSVDPDLGVYDFTHEIAPFAIRDSAYQISTVVPYWPAGTVFVSVVDPGVGTARRASVALLDNGSYVVSPDNGIYTCIADRIVQVREIDEARNRLPGSQNVHIFHGRDLFAYTAARLAAGILRYEDVGLAYPVAEVVRVTLTNVAPRVGVGWAEGGIYNVDRPYGAARINVRNADFQQVAGFAYGDHVRLRVTCGERLVFEGTGLYERTFGYADDSEAFLCGDIQPGEAQLLRLNVRHTFMTQLVSQLAQDERAALDYVVRFERMA